MTAADAWRPVCAAPWCVQDAAMMLRTLTLIPGLPAVLYLCRDDTAPALDGLWRHYRTTATVVDL